MNHKEAQKAQKAQARLKKGKNQGFGICRLLCFVPFVSFVPLCGSPFVPLCG
jgi:hypothetical protein